MGRPITMITGQWGDLQADDLFAMMQEIGFDGAELACGGSHFDVRRALNESDYCEKKWAQLKKYNLSCWALSNHCPGQAVLDNIDARHQAVLPDYIWGDGEPEGVRSRAIEHMKDTARAAKKFGVGVITGFTGSSIWPYLYSFPPVPPEWVKKGFELLAERWTPILDVFQENGIRFALEVHPTEIAFDIHTAKMALDALGNHPAFGFNFDPSHLIWQGIDPVKFIRRFPDRIYHVHMKDAALQLDGENGILGSHLTFGDWRRGWNFRSLGHGSVNFEEIIRALNDIDYQGPLSVEWEDSGMERTFGGKEAFEFVKKVDFAPSKIAFDSAFDKSIKAEA
ncbi:MAG: sugar phosphate isomerase/epimerase family protein [Planctomycetia bacterium]|nr:sugar phosphate isomerase/epimerase family protein [Planctomycetia bacterium]